MLSVTVHQYMQRAREAALKRKSAEMRRESRWRTVFRISLKTREKGKRGKLSGRIRWQEVSSTKMLGMELLMA